MNRWLALAVPLLLFGSAEVTAKPAIEQHFGSGAKVDEVDPDSAAATAGIRPGDVIVAINGRPINAFADIEPIVATSGKRPLLVDLDRGGSHMRVKVTPRVVTESTAQGMVDHKTLGISHTDYVVDPHPKRPQNLVNLLFPPDEPKPPPGSAPAEPERPEPRNLMELFSRMQQSQ
jgi:membrane-associated protease RseP (regulator of RpoE activity)